MNKIQFVVNPNPKYIDKAADEYILLNESMIQGENENIFRGRYSLLEYPLLDEIQYLKTKDYISNLSDRVVNHYGRIVNKKFELNLTMRQWKYYIGIWLEDFLFDAYDRFNKIRFIKADNVYMICNDDESVLPNQQKYGFINGYDPDYQMQLYSSLFSYMGKNVRKKQTFNTELRQKNWSKEIEKWKKRVNLIYRNPSIIKKKIGEKSQEELVGNTKTLVVESRMPKAMEQQILDQCNRKVEFVGPAYFSSRQNSITKKISIDYKSRKKSFVGFEGANEFEKYIDWLLIYFMPMSFFETLPEIYRAAEKITDDWSYKKIYHSAHITELFAMCCALMKNKETEIIDIQHSATYGDLFCFGFKEFHVWDRFITWGWEATPNTLGKIMPVAMSRLPLQTKKQYKQKEKILLATGIPELNDYGAGWNYDRYVYEQKEFISNLSDMQRKKLVIRLRISDRDKSGGLVTWCIEKYPEIKYENMNEIPFTDSLMESEFLVCDYYGTPHIEALMMGKPFVMFEGAHINVHNPAAREYLSKMESVGIYKKSGKEMALEISKHEKIDEWLSCKEIKDITIEYLNKMTGADKDIIDIWTEEFVC